MLAELWTRCDGATLNVSLGDYLTADDGVCTSRELMDSDIDHEVRSMFDASTTEENEGLMDSDIDHEVRSMFDASTTEEEEEEEKDCGEEYQQPTIREANNAMDTLRQYFYGADIHAGMLCPNSGQNGAYVWY